MIFFKSLSFSFSFTFRTIICGFETPGWETKEHKSTDLMLFSLVSLYPQQQKAHFHFFVDFIHSSKFLYLCNIACFACLVVDLFESAIQQRVEEVGVITLTVNISFISMPVNKDRDPTPTTESACRHLYTNRKRDGIVIPDRTP